ncbi:Holliday junction branch migration protein RuvA [Candidatus Kaiserbacteria bacterium]|nr:Holliday junction branch migration protein RuvA [Candidatus Kaiserbacteria bacterium]
MYDVLARKSLVLMYDVFMIGYIEGTVRAIRPTYCILLAGGVGYKVFATKEALASLKTDTSIAFWTHLAVREDILDLYGFILEEELRFFNLLLSVSGIGPRSALSILDIASVETLRSAISGGNAGYLTSVSGIGKKTAEKIVLELRDKVGLGIDGSGEALSGDIDTLDALRALGYSAQEAREALRKVPADIANSNERLREALKLLGTR